MTDARAPKSWLWPDRTIGKAESRLLRDEHNAAVNLVADLSAALETCLAHYGDAMPEADRVQRSRLVEAARGRAS